MTTNAHHECPGEFLGAAIRSSDPAMQTSAANGPKSVTCNSSGAQRSRVGNEPVTDRLSCGNAGFTGTAHS